MEALVDYEALVTGQFKDKRKVNSRKRKDDEAVYDFVKFLLSPDNVHASTYNHKDKPMVEIPRTYHAKD